MTPENTIGQLFPRAGRPPLDPVATESAAIVELQPVLQRRGSVPSPLVFEDTDDDFDLVGTIAMVEMPERPIQALHEPIEARGEPERIVERLRIERATEVARGEATKERNVVVSPIKSVAPTRPSPLQPDRSSVVTPPEPTRAASIPKVESSVEPAPTSRRPAQSPLTPLPPGALGVDVPSPEPARATPLLPALLEPEQRNPIIVQPVVRAAAPPVVEPELKAKPTADDPPPAKRVPAVPASPARTVELSPVVEKRKPTAQTEAKSADLPPVPLAVPAPVIVPAPILPSQSQPATSIEPPPERSAARGGVTLRIGSVQIIARHEPPRRPQRTARAARGHQIEPRLPFKSGRW